MTRIKKIVLFSLIATCIILSGVTAASAAPPGTGRWYYVNGYVKSNSGSPISGASVALYMNSNYMNTVATQGNGYFTYSVYLPIYDPIPYTWKAVVSKTGYITATKTVQGSPSGTTSMGTIYLTPQPISYSIHGFVLKAFNGHPITGAGVTLYRDVYEGWSQIGSTTTNANGYYSYTYNTYDAMSQCRVVSSASGYYDGADTVTVSGTDVNMGALSLSSLTPGTKYAIIVGISDYQDASLKDLTVCDEDASDWYNYLTTVMGYQSSNVWVYGDSHSENYPKYDGLATESNVIAALQNLNTIAGQNDIICFIFSGHGGGDFLGSSYLRMWDTNYGQNGQDGDLYDTELDDYVGAWSAGKIFIFLDSCLSGGFIPEIEALGNYGFIFMTTTCTEAGEGYNNPELGNSEWTYYFLEFGLIDHFESSPLTAMEECFDYAFQYYPHYVTSDYPQEADGYSAAGFTL